MTTEGNSKKKETGPAESTLDFRHGSQLPRTLKLEEGSSEG